MSSPPNPDARTSSNDPPRFRIPMLAPPHPVPIPHLLHLFPNPLEAHLAADPNTFPFPAPTPWNPSRLPFVILFIELMTALEHMQPDTTTLILLCHVWADPPTRDTLLLQNPIITDSWSLFCQSIPVIFPQRAMLANQSAHAIISSFRDRVLRFAPTDDIHDSLMSRFRTAFDISSPHSLHHLLYPHPEIFSRFDDVFNDISRRAYDAIEALEDNIDDTRIRTQTLTSLFDLLPALTESPPRLPIQVRIRRIITDVTEAHRRIHQDLGHILRILDMARNLYEVLNAQLPPSPPGSPNNPIDIPDA